MTATFAGITRAMQVIETGKISLFHSVGLEALENHPQSKIVIAVNYTETIQDLKDLFQKSGYAVVTLTGSMTILQRTGAIEAFQMASTDVRVLLANQAVCSTGIDLDDKDGNWPRVCFVSPNYSTITAYQLCHRFQRADTRSDAAVHFVYGKEHAHMPWTSQDATVELKVLNALASKANVMKATTPEQAEGGVVFPCDHEVFDVLENDMSSSMQLG